ncbi:uncharacterized protein METZ01_LOCUS503093, partial [marine metagenome]
WFVGLIGCIVNGGDITITSFKSLRLYK